MDGDTATLDATAINQNSVFADIDLVFSGKNDGTAVYKQEGGSSLPIGDLDIFSNVMGTITFDGTSVVSINSFVTESGPIPRGFQMGTGANAKNDAFGASAWIIPTIADSSLAHHWDINIELTAVPIPAAAWLFGSDLIGLVGVTRRKRAA